MTHKNPLSFFAACAFGAIIIGLLGFYAGKAVESVFIGLACLLSIGLFLYHIVQKNISPLPENGLRNPVLWGLAAVFLSWCWSAYSGIHPEETLEKTALMGVLCAGGYIMVKGLSPAASWWVEKGPAFVFYTLVTVCIIGIGEHFHRIPFLNEGHFAREFNKGLFLSFYSSIIALLIPFAWLYAIRHNNNYWPWVGVFIMVMACFIFGGRSGWLALITSCIFFLIFFSWTLPQNPARRVWGWVLSLGIGLIMGLLAHKDIIGERFYERRISLNSVKGPGSGRLDIWDFALSKVPDNLWFGIGPEGYRYLDFTGVKTSSYLHPHNIALEILLETGVIGLVLFITLIAIFIGRLIGAYHRSPPVPNHHARFMAIAILTSLVAFFTTSMTMTSFFHIWWFLYLLMIIVLCEITRSALLNTDLKAHKQTQKYPVAVSIIMPCYNGEKHIEAAIESIRAQHFTDWELIISDDGSTDGSAKIINNYAEKDRRIKALFTGKGTGAGPARNRAMDTARGRFIAFLDCDDIWEADKLEKQIAFMRGTGCGLCCTLFTQIDGHDNIIGNFTTPRSIITFDTALRGNDMGCSTTVYDRDQVGIAHMPPLEFGQDFALWLDLLKRLPYATVLRENLTRYRIHEGSRTRNKWASSKRRFKMIARQSNLPWFLNLSYFMIYAVEGSLKYIYGRKNKVFRVFSFK